jgi:hypothetical protein
MPVGPTPISAGFQIDISYTVSTLTHVMQLRCDASDSTGSWLLTQGAQPDIDPADAVAAFVTLVKATYHTGVSFVDWVLQRYSSGAYIPVAGGSLGIAGTSSTVPSQCYQSTFVFRDAAYNLVKWVALEQSVGNNLAHGGYGDMGPAFQAITNDLIDTTDGHAGAWVRGRAGLTLSAFRTFTISPNRRLRRKRGLV